MRGRGRQVELHRDAGSERRKDGGVETFPLPSVARAGRGAGRDVERRAAIQHMRGYGRPRLRARRRGRRSRAHDYFSVRRKVGSEQRERKDGGDVGIGGVDSSRLSNALGIEERLEEVREEKEKVTASETWQ